MKINKRKIVKSVILTFAVILISGLGACSKSRSYSELLREEERAVNVFLATQKVINQVPEDSISFITGKDAPFYRLDDDGYLYMQVINKGDMSKRVDAGDVVYFRFNRLNLKAVYLGYDTEWDGQMNYLSDTGLTSSNFVYKNNYLTSSQYFGQGIQWPLKFFGYGCEVNLVLQSYYGFQDDQTSCNPYLINVKYYAPEY